MSASKRFYESIGYSITIKKAVSDHKVDHGQRFIVNDHYNKSIIGHWEVVSESNLKGCYLCNRVLKNGSLSKSDSRSSFREFDASKIHEVLEQNN